MEAVTLTNISKRYGSVEALRGVSLSVAPGELFGIIGPDGAGKTSLFRILTTLLLADGGSASVCGLDVVKDYKAIRRRVGYMPGRFSLYPDLTVEENLNFFATVFHTTIEENYDLVRDIYRQIEPFRKRRAGAHPCIGCHTEFPIPDRIAGWNGDHLGRTVQRQGTAGFLLLVHGIASYQQHTIPALPRNIHIQPQQKLGEKYDVRLGFCPEPGGDPPGLLPADKAGGLKMPEQVHHPDIIDVLAHLISPF